MTTYLLLDAVFLTPAVILQAIAWHRRPRGHATALTVTVIALALLTVVFDSLMIGAGLFTYAQARIAGVRLWLAPVEDLAYPIAAALIGTAIWNLRPAHREPVPATTDREKAAR